MALCLGDWQEPHLSVRAAWKLMSNRQQSVTGPRTFTSHGSVTSFINLTVNDIISCRSVLDADLLLTSYWSFHFLFFSLLPPVPAQPSGFEAEAELDSRIMLSWLWPVLDTVTGFELLYWEANSPTDKVTAVDPHLGFESVCWWPLTWAFMLIISPQLRLTFGPAGSYAVDGLKPDTIYVFSLAARSDMGLGVFTKPVEARTAQSSE